jgi:hypothetical protein
MHQFQFRSITADPIRIVFDNLVRGIKVSWEVEEDARYELFEQLESFGSDIWTESPHHCGQGEINVTLFILEGDGLDWIINRTSSGSHTNKHFWGIMKKYHPFEYSLMWGDHMLRKRGEMIPAFRVDHSFNLAVASYQTTLDTEHGEDEYGKELCMYPNSLRMRLPIIANALHVVPNIVLAGEVVHHYLISESVFDRPHPLYIIANNTVDRSVEQNQSFEDSVLAWITRTCACRTVTIDVRGTILVFSFESGESFYFTPYQYESIEHLLTTFDSECDACAIAAEGTGPDDKLRLYMQSRYYHACHIGAQILNPQTSVDGLTDVSRHEKQGFSVFLPGHRSAWAKRCGWVVENAVRDYSNKPNTVIDHILRDKFIKPHVAFLTNSRDTKMTFAIHEWRIPPPTGDIDNNDELVLSKLVNIESDYIPVRMYRLEQNLPHTLKVSLSTFCEVIKWLRVTKWLEVTKPVSFSIHENNIIPTY